MKCFNCGGAGEAREYNFDEDAESPLFDVVTCRFCNGTGEM